MAGPAARSVSQVRIQTGEAQQLYAPTSLAYRIVNLEMTPENTLRAVRGVCPYEPFRGGDQYGGTGGLPSGFERFVSNVAPTDPKVIYGVFHAGLLNGKAPTLVVRAGTKLYLHAGWRRSWKVIYEGLTAEGRARFPDQFVIVNGNIVWTNGIDAPLVISHDGMVVPLGFSTRPGPVEVRGPRQPTTEAAAYPNSGGYSWPGRIGSVGDFVDTNDGAILAGRWRYARAWEDIHGNISMLSPTGVEATVALQRANALIQHVVSPDNATLYDMSTKLDDLPRQFVVHATGEAPPHAVATRLYRTADTNRHPADFRLLARIEGVAPFVYPDNVADARLGEPAKDYVKVPLISVMTSHAGALVVADGSRVMRSEVGYPGTLLADTKVVPDPDGAIITGLISHAGRLLAFTRKSVSDITDPKLPPRILARGVGCEAPRSIQALPNGLLVWLSRDGFYGWTPETGLVKVSDPIHKLVKNELSKGALMGAVAVVDPVSREYRCAVPRAGGVANDLMLCFDGSGWREMLLGFSITDVCVTDDPRYYVLFAGGREVTKPSFSTSGNLSEDGGGVVNIIKSEPKTYTEYDVYVMGHEVAEFDQPVKEYVYRSAWLRADDTALQPVQVHNLYVAMIDEVNEPVDVNVFSNGSFAPDADSPRKLSAVGLQVEDLLGDLVTGIGKMHARRLYWRKVPIALQSVNTWAFELRSTTPYHLAAFAIQVSVAPQGDSLTRIPFGEDI